MSRLIIFGDSFKEYAIMSYEDFKNTFFDNNLLPASRISPYFYGRIDGDVSIVNDLELTIPNDDKTYFVDMEIEISAKHTKNKRYVTLKVKEIKFSTNPYDISDNIYRIIDYITTDIDTRDSGVALGVQTRDVAVKMLMNSLKNIFSICHDVFEEGKNKLPSIEQFTSNIKDMLRDGLDGTGNVDLIDMDLGTLKIQDQDIIRKDINGEWKEYRDSHQRYYSCARVVMVITNYLLRSDDSDFTQLAQMAFENWVERINHAVRFPNVTLRQADMDKESFLFWLSRIRNNIDIMNLTESMYDNVEIKVDNLAEIDLMKITAMLTKYVKELSQTAGVSRLTELLFRGHGKLTLSDFDLTLNPLVLIELYDYNKARGK